jgi:hypothetical protein
MKDVLFITLAFQFIQPIFLGIAADTEFVPYPTFLLIIGIFSKLFHNHSYLKLSKTQMFSIFATLALFFYGIINSILCQSFSLKSLVLIYSPIICVLAATILFWKEAIPSKKVFIACWLIWLTSMAVQFILPSVYENVSSLFLPRSSDEFSERGVSGLAPEPSYTAEILLLFYAVWRLMYYSFSSTTRIFFLTTLALALILSGSITAYGLFFMILSVELIIKIVYYYFRDLSKGFSLIFNSFRSKTLIISSIILILGSLVAIIAGFQPPSRLLALFQPTSQENTSFLQYSSIQEMIYDLTLIKLGSWRSIGNYVGYIIGFQNFPFGGGLGSGEIAFDDVIYSNFSNYDTSIRYWIVTPFTYAPFVVADLGFLFFAMVFMYVIKATKLKTLLDYFPLEASMIISGLVCITIISPKSSLNPWFIMIYAASHGIAKLQYRSN